MCWFMSNEDGSVDTPPKADNRFELLVAGISGYAIYMLSPEGIVAS